LLRGGRYSKGPPIKLLWIWDVWGSGWPLLTGGRYSEVAVSTGLTVLVKYFINNLFDLTIRGTLGCSTILCLTIHFDLVQLIFDLV
jgi:hypothetical protein